MKKFVLLVFFVNITILLLGQDVIYTINYEKDGTNTFLDSILFENVSNNTRIIFDGLSSINSCIVNLTKQKLEVSTELSTPKNDDQIFRVIKNIPGEICIQYKDIFTQDINLSILNINGQKIFSQKINANVFANTLSINIPNSGIYILNINSTQGEASYKVVGLGKQGSIRIVTIENIKSDRTITKIKSTSSITESGFSFQKGDSLRVIAYSNCGNTYPIITKINKSDTLNLFYVGEEENYLIVDNSKYSLNMGYNVWFSELDCGNYNIFAHGLYLTSGVTIAKYGDDQTGKRLLPSGIGNMLVFNMYNKHTTLVPGKYIFIDSVDCSGIVTDGDSTYNMRDEDKFVSAVKQMTDPTFYALNVNLEIDWSTVDFVNPSPDLITKLTNYMFARVGIKEGSVTVEKVNEIYIITFYCIDNNGLVIKGKYKGNLNQIEFAI